MSGGGGGENSNHKCLKKAPRKIFVSMKRKIQEQDPGEFRRMFTQYNIQTEKPVRDKEYTHVYSTISTHKVNNTTAIQENFLIIKPTRSTNFSNLFLE